MLNVNKLALQAAKRLCDNYRSQNKRLFNEYCSALAKIKTAIGNGFSLSYTYNENNYRLTLYFIDENENEINIVFRDYVERQVAETFRNAYRMAQDLNSLCFGV